MKKWQVNMYYQKGLSLPLATVVLTLYSPWTMGGYGIAFGGN